MKKKLRVSLSAVLILAILTVTMMSPAVAVSGYDMSAGQWDAYWQEYLDDGSALYLAPGGDPSRMNFAWLGGGESDSPAVYVKPASSDGDFVQFTGVKVKLGSAVFSYQVTVEDLLPGTVYSYYYSADGKDSAVNTFKTAEDDGFSAIYVSDVHVSYNSENPDNLKNASFALHEIFSQAHGKNNDVSLIISSGDQGDHGLLSEYVGLFSSPVVKNIPLATTCGNHDYKETVYAYVTNNPNRYNTGQAVSPDRNGGDYYFVKNDVLFLFINSNWTSASDHYDFVKQTVAANPDVKWRVAVMHHDLYGGHIEKREDENRLLRLIFVPIFDEFGVDLVLTGHSHVFSRSHVMYGGEVASDIAGQQHVTDAAGTVYITTGSTCRPRGDVTEASFAIAYDHISAEEYIYNVVDFTYDTITFNSYAKGSDEPFEVFTLEKTSNEGGHPDGGHNEAYDFLSVIGILVNIYQTISFIVEKLFALVGIDI